MKNKKQKREGNNKIIDYTPLFGIIRFEHISSINFWLSQNNIFKDLISKKYLNFVFNLVVI